MALTLAGNQLMTRGIGMEIEGVNEDRSMCKSGVEVMQGKQNTKVTRNHAPANNNQMILTQIKPLLPGDFLFLSPSHLRVP